LFGCGCHCLPRVTVWMICKINSEFAAGDKFNSVG
jgi:hypothetical protein